MQYCVKCKKVCDDKITVCPSCKRKRTLREARNADKVFFMKTSDFEALELEEIFREHNIGCEIIDVTARRVYSPYDNEVFMTTKEIYIGYGNLEKANELVMQDNEDELLEEPKLTVDKVLKQVVMVGGFIAFVFLMVFLANFIAGLFN